LGPELDTAGITDSTAQLQAVSLSLIPKNLLTPLTQNIVLNVWCLLCALVGTQLIARWGRKPTALVCQALLTGLLFVIGGLSKVYADAPDSASSALVYGDVAAMFLFQGAYSLCWTPILNLCGSHHVTIACVLMADMSPQVSAGSDELLDACEWLCVHTVPAQRGRVSPQAPPTVQ
jgi:hypothetical protein